MAVYKQVWEWSDVNGATFSDVHYLDSADTPLPKQVDAKLINLILACRHKFITLDRIRTSTLSGNRLTQVQTVKLPGRRGDGATGPAAIGESAVFSVSGATGGNRRWWFRGLASGDVTRDAATGRDAMTDDFAKAFKAAMLGLREASYGIRFLTKLANTAANYPRIISIVGTPESETSDLVLDGDNAWAVDNMLLIYRVDQKQWPGLKGQFQVLKVLANTVTIRYRCPGVAANVALKGKVRRVNYAALSLYSPNTVELHHLGARDTRSPLSRSRGERRASHLRDAR